VKTRVAAWLLIAALLATPLFAATLSPEAKSKVDAMTVQIKSWASDPQVVSAVKAHNAGPPDEYSGMTNESWAALTVLDPKVRALTKNAVAEFLKTKKSAVVTEAFVLAADGTKVAFLSKTTYWCHKGKPKHDVPMTGKSWMGPVEVDESTGQQQVQVSVPVLDGGKPVGSLVVGLAVSQL
jgi:hypothetical protein